MDQSARKALFKWLDTASDQQLQHKLLSLELIFCKLTDPNVIKDFYWVKAKIIEELDAREEVINQD